MSSYFDSGRKYGKLDALVTAALFEQYYRSQITSVRDALYPQRKPAMTNEPRTTRVQYTYEFRSRNRNSLAPDTWHRPAFGSTVLFDDIEVMKKHRGAFGIGYGSDPQLDYRPVRVTTTVRRKPLQVEMPESLIEMAEHLNKAIADGHHAPQRGKSFPMKEGTLYVVKTPDGLRYLPHPKQPEKTSSSQKFAHGGPIREQHNLTFPLDGFFADLFRRSQ